MPRFRPEPMRRLGGLALVVASSACRTVRQIGSEVRNHPDALVGSWVDVAKSSPSDTALWVLGASGEDESEHMTRDTGAGGGDGQFSLTRRQHHGYWYASGSMADSAGRAICFTNRPGRSAPHCVTFRLDTIRNAGVAQRRLFLAGYQGAHHVSDRMLLAREP